MKEPFVLEWLGGPAEHHFRRARPATELDWASLDPARYPPALVAAARDLWMGIVVSEYAAIAAFAEVVAALTAARVPLDLIGMTSDFLADEVHHVELASRLLMQLGGAPPRHVDTTRLAPRAASELTPIQRANELALRVGCVAEVFASATAAPIMRETAHPLVRAVYERILRDEARHRRFGSLYFEWAADRLDPSEQRRLAGAALDALGLYVPLWRDARAASGKPTNFGDFDEHELGWIEPARYVTLAESAVRDEIVKPLAALGIELPSAEVDALLAAEPLSA
jgi:hypothetical protein